jgi:hypothetical protein
LSAPGLLCAHLVTLIRADMALFRFTRLSLHWIPDCDSLTSREVSEISLPEEDIIRRSVSDTLMDKEDENFEADDQYDSSLSRKAASQLRTLLRLKGPSKKLVGKRAISSIALTQQADCAERSGESRTIS